ncbi:MAG: hypothetical protein ACOY90_08650 [Candidatus Zhuqueibacterota bacterium]
MTRCKLLALFLFSIASIGLSQSRQSPYDQLLRAYQQLDYQTAKALGQKITSDYASHSLYQLAETHKILGVIAYSEGDMDVAKNQFESALSIDDNAQLDSVYVSPKIIQFFNEQKLRYIQSTPENASNTAQPPRYILIRDPRPAAALRSLALPGWGQLYKKEKRKGYSLAGAAGLSIFGTGMLHILQNNAHDAYLEATDPSDIESRYDRYNALYKWRNGLALCTAGIWLYSFFDALIAKSDPRDLPGVSAVKIEPAGSDGLMVTAIFVF